MSFPPSRWLALSVLCGHAAVASAVHPTITVSAEERYDDAALLQVAPGAGQMLTKLTAQVGLELKEPTLKASGWYAPNLLMHHASGALSADHRGALEVKKAVSRTAHLKLDARVWRVSDPTSLPRLGVAKTLSPVLYGKAKASGEAMLTERLKGRLAYEFEGARVYEAGREPGFTQAPAAELLARLSRRTQLGAEYRLQTFWLGAQVAHSNGLVGVAEHRLTRAATMALKAGPVVYSGPEARGLVLPRLHVELARDGEQIDLAFLAGEDLVGASGFNAALWAHFASAVAELDATEAVRLFIAASYFRNGRPLALGVDPLGPAAPGVTQGYAVAVGARWKVTQNVLLVTTLDRYGQVGAQGFFGEPARNIAAIRIEATL